MFGPVRREVLPALFDNSVLFRKPHSIFRVKSNRIRCHEIRSRARAKARWVDGQAY